VLISVNFNVQDQLLTIYSEFIRYWRKMGVQWDNTLFIEFKRTYDSARKQCQ